MTAFALPELVDTFDNLQRRIASYDVAIGLIEYDSQTVAPSAGAAAPWGGSGNPVCSDARSSVRV